MAHILFVKGNPKDAHNSNTLQLATRFLDTYRQHHPADSIEELDLYGGSVPLLDGDVFNGWGKISKKDTLQFEEQRKVERLNALVDQFLAADKLILAAPMWNFGYPPMVKAYLDSIAVAGRTFRYTVEGPEGLSGGQESDCFGDARRYLLARGRRTDGALDQSPTHFFQAARHYSGGARCR